MHSRVPRDASANERHARNAPCSVAVAARLCTSRISCSICSAAGSGAGANEGAGQARRRAVRRADLAIVGGVKFASLGAEAGAGKCFVSWGGCGVKDGTIKARSKRCDGEGMRFFFGGSSSGSVSVSVSVSERMMGRLELPGGETVAGVESSSVSESRLIGSSFVPEGGVEIGVEADEGLESEVGENSSIGLASALEDIVVRVDW